MFCEGVFSSKYRAVHHVFKKDRHLLNKYIRTLNLDVLDEAEMPSDDADPDKYIEQVVEDQICLFDKWDDLEYGNNKFYLYESTMH